VYEDEDLRRRRNCESVRPELISARPVCIDRPYAVISDYNASREFRETRDCEIIAGEPFLIFDSLRRNVSDTNAKRVRESWSH